MTRNPIQDIVPNGTRTIRNISLPDRKGNAIEESKPVKVNKHVSHDAENHVKHSKNHDDHHDHSHAEHVHTSHSHSEHAHHNHHVNHSHEKEFKNEFFEDSLEESDLKRVRNEFETYRSHKPAFSINKFVSKNKKTLSVFGISIILVASAMIVSNVFHKATVTITPRTANVVLNNDLSGIEFKSVSVEEIGSKEVKANGEKQVKTQSSGTIVIYNNYSNTSQRLVKNTRFETPEGLIYKISDSVTVPGRKGNIPGSVEAVVFAEEVGEQYNVGLKDFTIPGFKGDPRYKTFYARSKTPLEGGFSGTVKIVSDADMVKAQTDIKTEATMNLLKKVREQEVDGLVLFDGAYTNTCSMLPQESISDSQVLIKMKCVLSAALLDKEKVSSKLADIHVPTYKGESIVINNIETLKFTQKAGFDPLKPTITFNLSGNAVFEWTYSESELKSKLKGVDKKEAFSVLRDFPVIEKANVSIRPIWRTVFPSELGDIVIKKAQ